MGNALDTNTEKFLATANYECILATVSPSSYFLFFPVFPVFFANSTCYSCLCCRGIQCNCNNSGRSEHDFLREAFLPAYFLVMSLLSLILYLSFTLLGRGPSLCSVFAQHLRLSCPGSSLILVSAPAVQMANTFEIQTN